MTAQNTKPMAAKAAKNARIVIIAESAEIIVADFLARNPSKGYAENGDLMTGKTAAARFVSNTQIEAYWEYYKTFTGDYYNTVAAAKYNLLAAEIELAAAEKLDAYLNA